MSLTCRDCGLVWYQGWPRPPQHEVAYRLNHKDGPGPTPFVLLHIAV